MKLLRLLSKGLACYRLTLLLVKEAGPFDIFTELRGYLGVYDLGKDGKPNTAVGKMLSCPYCTGVWVALFLMLLPNSRVTNWFVELFAVAGVQTFLQDRTVELS